MRKTWRTILVTAAFTAMMSFAAFAAGTKKEYREEAAPIRAELKALEEQMAPLREKNKALAAHYKEIAAVKKETGVLNVDKEVWKEAKELRRQITASNNEQGNSTVADLRKAAKAASDQQDYGTALDYLKQALTEKKARYETLKEVNRIWAEIDGLLK